MAKYSSTSVLLLGIEIDWKLNFNNHVLSLCSKAYTKVNAFCRLRSHLNAEQKLLLYNSFIMSTFNYCPIIWMFCGKTADLKVNNIQRRALQALYNDFYSSYQELLNRGKHLKIHELNQVHLLTEVYKCIKKESPSFLHNIFMPKESNHQLRINNLLSLPKTSTKTWGLHSFAYRGSSSWNSPPDDIKCSSLSSVFKSRLKDIGKLSCACKLCITI